MKKAVEKWLAVGEAADRKVHEERSARAKARLEEEERSGAHERLRNLDFVHRRLLGRRRDALASQALVLVGRMIDDVQKAPHHNYDPGDRAQLELLLRKIEEKEAKHASKARGYMQAAENKKKATEWHNKIEARVKQMLAASKSAENIGALLASEAERAAGTVAKFAAEVRDRLGLKKERKARPKK